MLSYSSKEMKSQEVHQDHENLDSLAGKKGVSSSQGILKNLWMVWLYLLRPTIQRYTHSADFYKK